MSDSNIRKIDKNTYFFIAAILAIFVPAPGRFAYAITLLLLFNLQMILATLFFHLMNFLKLDNLRNILVVVELVSVTILFKQLLILFCPIMALTLGFCIYLPTFSTIAIQFFFESRKDKLKTHFFTGVSNAMMFSAYSLVFFLLREIIGYATISFPGKGELIVFHLPVDVNAASAGVFFATIPGCLSMIAICFSLYIFVGKKFEIVRNTKLASKIMKNEGENSEQQSSTAAGKKGGDKK